MKKFSLKFMLIFILSFFSSFVYADGVFSKYYNGRFNYVINVPTTKYENGVGGTENLNFIKNSNLIPTKNFFSAYEGANSDGLTIQDINENIIILAYGSYFLNIIMVGLILLSMFLLQNMKMELEELKT